MRRIAVLQGLGLVLVGLLLAGCAAPPEITAVPPPGQETASTVEPGVEEGVTGTLAASRYPLPAPEGLQVAQADSSNCISCHTEEETLQALAQEPEELEELSEGEG